MNSSFDRALQPSRARLMTAACLSVALALAGCGDKQGKAASQTAAKVNKEEITVPQIDFMLQQQRGLKPEQADAAGKQILERLIDQELALQKAADLKLDREPRVVQALEAARRDILARAYIEKAGEAAAKPTPDEVKKYYNEKPALFKERRIYSLQELAIEARAEQVEKLRTQLAASKSINDFVDYLKTNDIRFTVNQAVRGAEQLPLTALDAFAKMKDGQATLAATPNGAQVIVLAGSRSEPVDEARALPAIEQYLLNEAKRKVVEADIKAMRAAAKVEYVGRFAEGAASAPAAAPLSAASDPDTSSNLKGTGIK